MLNQPPLSWQSKSVPGMLETTIDSGTDLNQESDWQNNLQGLKDSSLQGLKDGWLMWEYFPEPKLPQPEPFP